MQSVTTPTATVEPAATIQPIYDTTLLKAVATLLICNSHLEAFYQWRWMAGDGLLGNSMFFLLAGFGLTLSQAHRARGFVEWYSRRLKRLYPAFWITMAVVCLLEGRFGKWKPWDYFTYLIYPTEYTFIGVVVILYIPIYMLIRSKSSRTLVATFIACMVPYFFLYWQDLRGVPDNAPLSLGSRSLGGWYLFYFQTMLLGCWLALRPKYAKSEAPTNWIWLISLFLVYVAVKLLMVKGHFGHYYFVLNYLTLGILYTGFRAGTSTAAVRFLRYRSFLATSVSLLATLTFELYLTHSNLAHVPELAKVLFPLNIVIFFGASLVSAWALRWVVTRMFPPNGTITLQSRVQSGE